MWVTDSSRGRVWIDEFTRDEFLAERWTYQPGGHVTILAPSGSGKSTFTLQLLEHTARPDLPVVNLALKPRDSIMSQESKRLGYRVVKTWPPLRTTGRNGWTVWPSHSDDPTADDERLARIMLKVLRWCYANASKRGRKGLIVNADEMEEIQRLLALLKPSQLSILRALYRRMRSNGGGLWSGCQAPKFLVTDAYSQAGDLFLGNDPDKRNRDRFGEIGGVDPDVLRNAVQQLPPFHWLHCRRAGRTLCIIGP